MITKNYSAGLVSQSCCFIEFKEYLKLVRAGTDPEEIKNKIVKNNLFGAPNEYRAKEIYRHIKRRASSLDKDAVELFFSSDLATQKLINFICIMRSSRILFEFVNEVYREKIILGAEIIDKSDISIFFKHKEVQSEEISRWKEPTKKKLCSTFLTFLTDSGLLAYRDKKRYITRPILDIELEKYLEASGESDLIKAMTGEY